MNLTQRKGTSRWIIAVDGEKLEKQPETRGQVYALIRAARLLGILDTDITVSLEAEYDFTGE